MRCGYAMMAPMQQPFVRQAYAHWNRAQYAAAKGTQRRLKVTKTDKGSITVLAVPFYCDYYYNYGFGGGLLL